MSDLLESQDIFYPRNFDRLRRKVTFSTPTGHCTQNLAPIGARIHSWRFLRIGFSQAIVEIQLRHSAQTQRLDITALARTAVLSQGGPRTGSYIFLAAEVHGAELRLSLLLGPKFADRQCTAQAAGARAQ